MQTRNSVSGKIFLAVFGAFFVFILTGIVCLSFDEKRARVLAKQMYPNAEILAADTTNRIISGNVACAMYDSEYHLVFQQNFERKWFRIRASEAEGQGFDAALEKRRQLDAALAAFAEQTDVPYLARYTTDGIGVCIYTAEQDPDKLTQMHARLLSLQQPDAVQPFSIVRCSAEKYAQVQDIREDEFIRQNAELTWSVDGCILGFSASDPRKMLGFGKSDTEFTWSASSAEASYAMRAEYIANGKMDEYPEFNADTPLVWYCEVFENTGTVQSGVRQWAVSGKKPSYNSQTDRWEEPLGQSYIFHEGVIVC